MKEIYKILAKKDPAVSKYQQQPLEDQIVEAYKAIVHIAKKANVALPK